MIDFCEDCRTPCVGALCDDCRAAPDPASGPQASSAGAGRDYLRGPALARAALAAARASREVAS